MVAAAAVVAAAVVVAAVVAVVAAGVMKQDRNCHVYTERFSASSIHDRDVHVGCCCGGSNSSKHQ